MSDAGAPTGQVRRTGRDVGNASGPAAGHRHHQEGAGYQVLATSRSLGRAVVSRSQTAHDEHRQHPLRGVETEVWKGARVKITKAGLTSERTRRSSQERCSASQRLDLNEEISPVTPLRSSNLRIRRHGVGSECGRTKLIQKCPPRQLVPPAHEMTRTPRSNADGWLSEQELEGKVQSESETSGAVSQRRAHHVDRLHDRHLMSLARSSRILKM